MHTAVVLAGGFSTRFGDADKALAPLVDRPLVRHVVDRLSTIADAVVVNCRSEQVDGLATALDGADATVRFAEDPDPDRGPVAGIRTGLAAIEREYAAVVACDMPFVDPAFVASLFEDAAGRDAAIPQLDDEWYQTTQAVYRAAPMVAACDRALERGDPRILAAAEELDRVTVGDAAIRARTTPRTFENVNTRADLADAESLLRSLEDVDHGGRVE